MLVEWPWAELSRSVLARRGCSPEWVRSRLIRQRVASRTSSMLASVGIRVVSWQASPSIGRVAWVVWETWWVGEWWPVDLWWVRVFPEQP